MEVEPEDQTFSDSGIMINANATIMILDKDEFLEKATLVHHTGYTRNLPAFVSMLRWTRMPFLKRNGFFMAVMQSNMLRSLIGFQQELRKMEGQLASSSDAEEKKKLERDILIEKQWIRVLQTIADGIAWRAYSFNRPILRVMSENSDPGDLTQADYDYVAVLRNLLVKAPYFRVLNDLTRVLRIGDLTVFYPGNKSIIYEAKQKGRKIIDSSSILKEMGKHHVWPNPQKARHLIAQMAVINKKIDVPVVENGKIIKRLEIDVVSFDFTIAHHFAALRKLIRKADRNVYAAELVEEGYYIQVMALDKLNATNLEKVKTYINTAPDWAAMDDGTVIKSSNFDSFMDAGKEFPRNILPYSVLPLSSLDCVRLMMGGLQVSVFADTRVLRKKLIERGWRVTDTDFLNNFTVIKPPAKRHLFDHARDETFFRIEKDHGNATYKSSVLFTDLLMATSSFYGFNFVLDTADAMFENAKVKRETRWITRNFEGEIRVLR